MLKYNIVNQLYFNKILKNSSLINVTHILFHNFFLVFLLAVYFLDVSFIH